MAGSQRKSTKSARAKKAKKRAPRGHRTTTFKVTKTKAREYREAKNPDFQVRIVRHGRKPAEYFVDATHLSSQQATLVKAPGRWGEYIALTTKLKNGEIREIPLPYSGKRIEQFIQKSENEGEKINALRKPDELFGFTVEGHRVPTTFKNMTDLQKLVQYYRNTGTKNAKISIFRIKKQSDWVPQEKSIAAIKRHRPVKEPRRKYATKMPNARPKDNDVTGRQRRYYEKIKDTAAYKEKHRKYQADYRKRLRKKRAKRKNR